MLIVDLLESAADEMAMYKQVRQAANTVVRDIYRGAKPFHEIELGSYGDFYAYRSREDLGLDKAFLLMLGVRRNNTVGMSGMVVDFGQSVFGYEKGVAIYCMSEFSLTNMRTTVNSVGFIKVFEHEFLHMLDNERTADRIVTPTDPKANPAGYYNSPAEFNAYYHDIAKNLLAVIEQINAHPHEAQDYLDLYGFSGEWKADLSHLLIQDVYAQRFVQSLTPERKKALLRRLYRLYQQMLDSLSAASAPRSHDVGTPP